MATGSTACSKQRLACHQQPLKQKSKLSFPASTGDSSDPHTCKMKVTPPDLNMMTLTWSNNLWSVITPNQRECSTSFLKFCWFYQPTTLQDRPSPEAGVSFYSFKEEEERLSICCASTMWKALYWEATMRRTIYYPLNLMKPKLHIPSGRFFFLPWRAQEVKIKTYQLIAAL